MTDVNEVWILSWYYSDKSAFGLMRVYVNGERARMDLELLEGESTGKTYQLESLPVTT